MDKPAEDEYGNPKHGVLIEPEDYPNLLAEIGERGYTYRPDRSNLLAKLVFDSKGLPHREDKPEIYPKWNVQTLNDLVLSMKFMVEKPHAHWNKFK